MVRRLDLGRAHILCTECIDEINPTLPPGLRSKSRDLVGMVVIYSSFKRNKREKAREAVDRGRRAGGLLDGMFC